MDLKSYINDARRGLIELPQVDEAKMRIERLNRLQSQLAENDLGGILLYDPINIRYATDCRNMQIWTMHNAARYCLVPTEGKAIMFDFVNCGHLSKGLDTIAESRPGTLWYHHTSGDKRPGLIDAWADELADVIAERCGNTRIAIDKLEPGGRSALTERQITTVFGQDIIERARCIKTLEELKAQQHSALVCMTALRAMRDMTVPGATENDLWAVLASMNSTLGGDYIETKLVVAGSNTNPWYTEASNKVLQPGEFLAIDTDMIGPFGYNTDISRTWLCQPAQPTPEQKTLYQTSYDQVHTNMGLIKAGVSLREFAEKAWKMPERYQDLDCRVLVHGTGMCNEYPQVPPLAFWERTGYNGVFEENMTLSIESYIGEVGRSHGVKLEQMVRVTDKGCEIIADFPFEEELLN
ncbi:M24 family metallopeptidase [Ruegeria meonggei]|uniref:Aminopeptidase n=1 Tax=Ruegeria meonggei TaxID=1446476 RepID=A0A1X7A025_9RHOB|nr:Xaa-Pro peptidase family protein [Ruegeria meonggei]SLN66280.1 aminopeptidase [Ruegeria meonggei]